jgi:hypothetical protein
MSLHCLGDVQVEASLQAQSGDDVFWPILHKANNTTIAIGMRPAGDATNTKDAAEALDSLLLMDEAWYANNPSTSRVCPDPRLTLAGMRATLVQRKNGQMLCAHWCHASSPSHIQLPSSGATSLL